MPTKRLKAEERRRQIVEAAGRIFAAHGFESTRIKDIALACEIDPALIYMHFRSKDALYKEATIQYYRNLKKMWIESIQGAPSSIAGMKKFCVMRFREIYETPELASGLFRAIASSQHSPELKVITTEVANEAMDLIEGLVLKAQEEGDIRRDLAPSAVALWFLGYYFFIFYNVRDGSMERYPLVQTLKHVDQLLHVFKPVDGKAGEFSQTTKGRGA